LEINIGLIDIYLLLFLFKIAPSGKYTPLKLMNGDKSKHFAKMEEDIKEGEDDEL